MDIRLGKTIKQLRESRKMTQLELATKLGITKSMISAYETEIRQPSYDVLMNIAKYFNTSMDYLFGFSGYETLDVSGLHPDQKTAIAELISLFMKKNAE